MSSSTTVIGDRRRQALDRAAALRRHPSRRMTSKPAAPPTAAFYAIAVVVAVFVMLGLVMVLSASSINQFHEGHSPFRIFNKQLMWAALGLVGLWIGMRVPYHFWRRLVLPMLIGSCGMMLLPFIPGVGDRVNDANAWIAIGPLSLQPSEFLKLSVLLYCANLLAKRRDEMGNPQRTLVPVMLVAIVGSGLCLVQSDLGSAIVLASIVFVVAFIAGAPLRPMAAAASIGAVGALAFVVSSPRRQARFTAFLDIAAHKDHLSYQTYQAMIALAQGGLAGEGVGQGKNKLGDFLPLAHSDFIFAVVAEELGMIGVIAVLGGFLILAYAGVQVALATQDRFASLLAGGIVIWFVVQTSITVGGVTGMMPVTGLTLPFFSAGGSSLFVTMTAAGLLLNVARNVR
jgi:cell division protein FtsW